MKNSITDLFGITYPIIQAGMIWTSGWRLAAAVSNAGGLGIIGAGSMYPHVLEEHLLKYRAASNKPFGVNVPLLYPDIDKIMDIIVAHKVPIVFTSAGNPKTWTEFLKRHGIIVVHVIASVKFAKKCEEVGVDAIVAEVQDMFENFTPEQLAAQSREVDLEQLAADLDLNPEVLDAMWEQTGRTRYLQ